MSVFFIPLDLVIPILARLPVKSLLRFKSVSKTWYSFITSPKFIDAHLRYASSNEDSNRLILKHCLSDTYQLRVSYLSYGKDFDVPVRVPVSLFDKIDENSAVGRRLVTLYGSCKGIICALGDTNGEQISLWNPATREIKRLPPPAEKRIIHPKLPPGEVPPLDFVQVGFGFDSKSNDYKVVRILCFNDDQTGLGLTPHVEVYNLSSNRWRKIDQFSPIHTYLDVREAFSVYVDGNYYWCTNDGSLRRILSFDFTSELFDILPTPHVKKISDLLTVHKYKGSLAMVSMEHESTCDFFFALWVLNRDDNNNNNKTWSKLFRVKVPGTCLDILGFLSNDKIIFRQDMCDFSFKLGTYDLTCQQFKMEEYDVNTYDAHELQVVHYVESLATFGGTLQFDQLEESL